jgi:drug/metabolite transporter (DMT)-like permease
LNAALLMAAAGVAWGLYSLLGRGQTDPIAATARNFVLTIPIVLLLIIVNPAPLHATPRGAALAVASGAVTSGLGYVVWYAALRGLTPASASIVQLATPVLAALGGAALLGETLSLRLGVATALVLGGVFWMLTGRRAPKGLGSAVLTRTDGSRPSEPRQ